MKIWLDQGERGQCVKSEHKCVCMRSVWVGGVARKALSLTSEESGLTARRSLWLESQPGGVYRGVTQGQRRRAAAVCPLPPFAEGVTSPLSPGASPVLPCSLGLAGVGRGEDVVLGHQVLLEAQGSQLACKAPPGTADLSSGPEP